jgi:hypothetical protein
VNHTTDTIAIRDTSLALCRHRRNRRTSRVGRGQGQRSIWPVATVMPHEDIEDPAGSSPYDNGVLATVRTTGTPRAVRLEAKPGGPGTALVDAKPRVREQGGGR